MKPSIIGMAAASDAAKLTDRLFDVSDIVRLLEASESKKAA